MAVHNLEYHKKTLEGYKTGLRNQVSRDELIRLYRRWIRNLKTQIACAEAEGRKGFDQSLYKLKYLEK